MTDTNNQDPIVIVGGGQAAVQLCLAIRKEKVSAPAVMLSEEANYPYHRPPLSKSFLSGETDEEKLNMRPPSFYQSKAVEVRLETPVLAIDPQARTVSTSDGVQNYQSLVIATGARPRPLPISGADLGGVHLLRDLDQSKHIARELQNADSVAVIGAGFIGLEFASVAAKMGKQVTVFDTVDRVMAQAVSPTMSAWFEKQHRSNGIDLQLNNSVANIVGKDKVEQLETTSGDRLDCDLLVIGIGVIPNDEIASTAGLACDDGIIIDEYCQTSVEGIYAAGDCARHPYP